MRKSVPGFVKSKTGPDICAYKTALRIVTKKGIENEKH